MPSSTSTLFSVARFHRELERLFDEALGLAAARPRAGEWVPPVDVIESGEGIVILLEAPGIDVADLEVCFQGGTVFLSGRKRPAKSATSGRFHRMERSQGSFERAVEVPWPVDSRRARARVEGGLLIVELPKIAERRARRLQVTIEMSAGDGESALETDPADRTRGERA